MRKTAALKSTPLRKWGRQIHARSQAQISFLLGTAPRKIEFAVILLLNLL